MKPGSHPTVDQSEVIDLLNPSISCTLRNEYELQKNIAYATGSYISEYPVICGGFTFDDDNNEDGNEFCYEMGFADCQPPKLSSLRYDFNFTKKNIFTNTILQNFRVASASVAISEHTLWVTGGLESGIYDKYYQSTEFINLCQPSRPGPNLPKGHGEHCMVKIDDKIILSGPADKYSNPYEENTLIIDLASNFSSMTYGPNMKNPRWLHSCGTFERNGKEVMIVAGGLGSESASTEIWDPKSDEGWVQGNFLVFEKHQIFHFFRETNFAQFLIFLTNVP